MQWIDIPRSARLLSRDRSSYITKADARGKVEGDRLYLGWMIFRSLGEPMRAFLFFYGGIFFKAGAVILEIVRS